MPSNAISIAILVFITLVVSLLMAFGYYSIIKTTKKLSNKGLLDDEFQQEDKKNGKRWVSITLSSISIGLASILLFLCGVGIYYRVNNDQLVFQDKTAFVISSDSMKSFYNDDYQTSLVHDYMSYKDISEEEASKYIASTQFETGDLLGFSKLHDDDTINLYEVYGYMNKKGQIITHRLVAIEDGKYVFRGDYTMANDILVNRDQILYHYGEVRVPGVGIFVLFFSSSFGLYSIFITVAVMVVSDIYKHRYEKIRKERLTYLGGSKHAYQ